MESLQQENGSSFLFKTSLNTEFCFSFHGASGWIDDMRKTFWQGLGRMISRVIWLYHFRIVFLSSETWIKLLQNDLAIWTSVHQTPQLLPQTLARSEAICREHIASSEALPLVNLPDKDSNGVISGAWLLPAASSCT